VDDREVTSFSERKTGEAGTNPEMERLRQRLDERTERLEAAEEQSARMAETGAQFNDNSAALADYYKNKKWWQL